MMTGMLGLLHDGDNSVKPLVDYFHRIQETDFYLESYIITPTEPVITSGLLFCVIH